MCSEGKRLLLLRILGNVRLIVKLLTSSQSVLAIHAKRICLVVWSSLHREGAVRWFSLLELGSLALYYLEHRRRGLNRDSDRWR